MRREAKGIVGSVWQSIGLTISLLGIVAGLLAAWHYSEKRGLTVYLDTEIPVVSVNEEFAEDIEVQYRSTPISSLHVLQLTVKNSGNRPIERPDYDTPLSFQYGGAVASSPTLVECNPSSLTPELTVSSPDSVTLQPLLLNARDSFTFRTFILNKRNAVDPVRINGRISGITEIRLRTDIPDVATGSFMQLVVEAMSNSRFVPATLGIASLLLLGLLTIIGVKRRLSLPAMSLAAQRHLKESRKHEIVVYCNYRVEESLMALGQRHGLPSRPDVDTALRLSEKGVIPADLTPRLMDFLARLRYELSPSSDDVGHALELADVIVKLEQGDS